MKNHSDYELIILAQQGNHRAHHILLSRYDLKIQRMIQAHLHDKTLTQDLSQEVLLKIYRYLQYFKLQSHFSTWIYRITKNTIKNHYRKTRQDSFVEWDEQENTQHSPESDFLYQELLERAFSQLSEELQHCYGPYLFTGESYEKIALKVGCPVGTVRSRIFRAKQLIRQYVTTN